MSIQDKKQMSEEDIKRLYITPALEGRGWKDHITMEAQVTDGRMEIIGTKAKRQAPKSADYLLYLIDNKPIAVVEAKNNRHSASWGMQQAKVYAEMMDLPFAYSSNGDAFQEYDYFTGKEREIPMSEFPTYDELVARYYAERAKKDGLTEDEKKIISQPYFTSQGTHAPRYFQRNAINRTVEAIARGDKRLLLVMATGTGKTYTAFQIVYRLLKSGLKKRILYLADRNVLVNQTIDEDFKPLEKTIYKVDFSEERCLEEIKSHEVIFALYQQLVGDKGEKNHLEMIPKGYFDLVIVDECHRGSTNADKLWHTVLEYFSEATQIGMTATPKETKYISNINYFGEPIYTYSLKQGIEDGFLAPFKVIEVTLNISNGWRPTQGQKDIYGVEIADRIYNNSDYDYPNGVVIQDRINVVAREITKYLTATGRMQKTIVFCPTEEAAERMRAKLAELNSDIMKQNPDYVVRITGSDDHGRGLVKNFISVEEKYPVIATTSEMLSTGVNCKMTKLIVLDKMIESMTTFKQIIGRGTRINEENGKTHFVVMDFRGVSKHFADPEWDGEIEMDKNFLQNLTKTPLDDKEKPENEGSTGLPRRTIVDKFGCRVSVINRTVSTYNADGKLIKQEELLDYARTKINEEFSSLADFVAKWKATDPKADIEKSLQENGLNIEELNTLPEMMGFDTFDIICNIAYGKRLLTKAERADNVAKSDFFSQYQGGTREILEILLDRYRDSGVNEIEKMTVLSLPVFEKYGKAPRILRDFFGGTPQYKEAIKQLEEKIYTIEA